MPHPEHGENTYIRLNPVTPLDGEDEDVDRNIEGVVGGVLIGPLGSGLLASGAIAALASDSSSSSLDTIAPDAPSVDTYTAEELSGRTEANATVQVRDKNGNVMGETVADPDGKWSIKPEPKPTDGQELDVVSTDPAGNTSAPTVVTIDATAPDAPVISILSEAPMRLLMAESIEAAEKNTGGRFINKRTVTIGISAEPNSDLDVFLNGKILYENIKVGESGKANVTIKVEADGNFYVQARATDPAGNQSSVSSEFEFTVDTIAPGITLNPSDGKSLTGTTESEAKVTVSLSDGRTLSTVAAKDGSWSITGLTIADGAKVTASAEDRAGNVSDVSAEVFIARNEPLIAEIGNLQYTRFITDFHYSEIKQGGVLNYSNNYYSYNGDGDDAFYQQRYGGSEEVKYTFQSNNRIVDTHVYINGVKVESGDSHTQHENHGSVYTQFRFAVNGQNIVRFSIEDEHGNTESSNNVIFAVDPFSIDLNNDGIIETKAIVDGVKFDIEGDGMDNVTSWVGGNDGILVLDKNKNGTIDSGKEIIGIDLRMNDGIIAEDAVRALGWFDKNKDGRIDQGDAVYSELQIWQDANQNGVSEAGELHSLSSIGVSSISLDFTGLGKADSNGVTHESKSEVSRYDGSTSKIEGLLLNSQQDNLSGSVLEYSTNILGESIAKVVKDNTSIDMAGLHTLAMPTLDLIDMRGHGSSKISMDKNALDSLLNEDKILTISGDEDDTVKALGARLEATGIEQEGTSYDVYNYFGHELFVEPEISVVL